LEALVVLCYKDANLKQLKNENILKTLVDALRKAHEEKQIRV